MLQYLYLAIVLMLIGLIVTNMFREKGVFFKIDASLVLVPLILRLFLIK